MRNVVKRKQIYLYRLRASLFSSLSFQFASPLKKLNCFACLPFSGSVIQTLSSFFSSLSSFSAFPVNFSSRRTFFNIILFSSHLYVCTFTHILSHNFVHTIQRVRVELFSRFISKCLLLEPHYFSLSLSLSFFCYSLRIVCSFKLKMIMK